jgi:type VI secretion system ImpM family protein
MNEIGCFGKIPAHGDFVWQALPAGFVTPWDNWLQSQLVGLQEQRPDDWLDAYLCGPIWRFLIQDEDLGASTWCGIITPSVDIVGRYFPLTIATALPRYCSVIDAPRLLTPWLEGAEEAALQALASSLPIEDVLAKVRSNPVPDIGERNRDTAAETGDWAGCATADEYWSEQLLDKLVYNTFEKPCHWSTIEADSGALRYLLTEGFSGFTELFAT